MRAVHVSQPVPMPAVLAALAITNMSLSVWACRLGPGWASAKAQASRGCRLVGRAGLVGEVMMRMAVVCSRV